MTDADYNVCSYHISYPHVPYFSYSRSRAFTIILRSLSLWMLYVPPSTVNLSYDPCLLMTKLQIAPLLFVLRPERASLPYPSAIADVSPSICRISGWGIFVPDLSSSNELGLSRLLGLRKYMTSLAGIRLTRNPDI